jgi:methyl-accepting chemotaxis protein
VDEGREHTEAPLAPTPQAEDQASVATRRGIGIRGKLFIAFAVVGAMSLACAAIGWLGFAQVRTAQHSVVNKAVPAMTHALQLAEGSAALAAAAPTLAATANNAERHDVAAMLAERGQAVRDLIASIAQEGFAADTVAALEDAANSLLFNLDSLDEAARDRLQASAAVTQKIQVIEASEAALMPLLADQINQSVGEVDNAAGGLYDIGLSGKTDGMIDRLDGFFDTTLDRRVKLFELRQAVADVLAALRQAATEPNTDRLTGLASRISGAEGKISAYSAAITDAASGEKIRAATNKLLQASAGDSGLFALRRDELQAHATLAALLQDTRAQAEVMSHSVAQMVEQAHARIDQASNTADAAIETSQTLLAVLAVVALLVAIAVAWIYVGRSIVGRLTALATVMHAVAAGQLDAEIPPSGADEIGAMADALVVFRDTAREVESANRRAEDERILAAQERRTEQLAMADRFEASVARVVTTVIGAATEMQETATGMAATAAQTTQASGIATLAADQATHSVHTVAAAAEQLSASVAEISRQVTQSSTIANTAAADAARTNAVVAELDQAAARIGDVVKLISEIAEQTNLLALNAAIEAARAGEAGKGFAVVAGEVKNLASQTAKATDDIDTQVRAMQSTTQDVVAAIHNITRTIGSMDEIASAIAGAVQQQGAATLEIANSAQSAAQGTTQATAEINSVREAADQTGHSANAVLGSAQQMAGLANDLQSEVEQFLGQVRAA